MGLRPGALTPRLHEGAARLGAWLPFPAAAAALAAFTHTAASEPTLRRRTRPAAPPGREPSLASLPRAPARTCTSDACGHGNLTLTPCHARYRPRS